MMNNTTPTASVLKATKVSCVGCVLRTTQVIANIDAASVQRPSLI